MIRGICCAGVVCLAWVGCSLALATQPVPEVVLGTNAQSAYSSERKPREQLGVLSHVDCVFSHIPYQSNIIFEPWRRAQQEVRVGQIDGFFTAMEDVDIEPFATLSDPLVLQKWYWFTRADAEKATQPARLRKGAILGSHQQLWFEANGDSAYLSAQDLPQLIKLLYSGRIDAILADRAHFEKAAAALEISPDRYRAQFDRYVPLGVYFGNDFLAGHRDFHTQFNQHIHLCVPQRFALTATEQDAITQLLQTQIDALLHQQALLHRLRIHGASKPLSDELIQRQDSQWRARYRNGQQTELLALMDAELLGVIRAWRAENPLVSEIIVMGTQGLTLAATPVTSDYWQGDEAKFQQGAAMPAGHWFFDEVSYDQSARRFQVQVSVPVITESEHLGVLTLGVDIENVLHKRY
ncbi:substrate-binding periplasmic protein [Gilvimarinus xylanilyticus]|uniref:Solute-binding protein family 3/N-terminal domain-containing protein n=1 Tax=Gilvimarinus xylanilyticus TaxID=2944139 RepID=A0A9X2I656_9GAMM|nr:hypothetical protein [Gilvimarinus xylanilyticus]MCP8900666.1 hypothetical protein [Gilvimarinus xylanilyticus]